MIGNAIKDRELPNVGYHETQGDWRLASIAEARELVNALSCIRLGVNGSEFPEGQRELHPISTEE